MHKKAMFTYPNPRTLRGCKLFMHANGLTFLSVLNWFQFSTFAITEDQIKNVVRRLVSEVKLCTVLHLSDVSGTIYAFFFYFNV